MRGCENRLIAGAVFEGGQPRIVRIDDFMLEAIPEGPTLFLQNRDAPGVVGTVGTLLPIFLSSSPPAEFFLRVRN